MGVRTGIGYDSHRLVAGRRLVARRGRARERARARRTLGRRRARARRDRRPCSARPAWATSACTSLTPTSAGATPTRSSCCAARSGWRAAPATRSINVDATVVMEAPKLGPARERDARAARARRSGSRPDARQRQGDHGRGDRLRRARRGRRRARDRDARWLSAARRRAPLRHAHARGAARSRRATRDGSGSTPAGRPCTAASTSATRVRSCVFSLLKRFLVHAGYDGHARHQHHRRQRQDLRRRRSAARASSSRAGDDRRLHRRHRPARARAPRPRAAARASRSARSSRRSRRCSPAGTPTRSSGDVYFRVRSDAALRRALAAHARRDGPGGGRRGRRAQGGPAGLRAVEGPEAGRGQRLGRARGVAGGPAGTSSARRWPRALLGVGFDIHGGGLDLLFPHHENEAAQTRCARGAELAALLDAQRHARGRRRREDVEVGRQHHARCTRRSTATDATRSMLYLASGHYRQPIAYGEETLAAAAASVARIREAGAPARRGRLARRRCGRCATASSRRSPTTSTRPRRSRRCGSGSARPTAGARRVGDARSARDARRARRSRTCFDAGERRRRTRSRRSPRERRGARARPATTPRADALRAADRGARLVGARHARRRLRARAAGVIVYGRNAGPRGAARPPRRHACGWILATDGGRARAVAREPRRAHAWPRPKRSSEACGSREHQGVCAELAGVPVRLRRRAPRPAEAPLIVALDEVQDPQNLGAICRTAECVGASGVVICERRAARGHARPCAAPRPAPSSTCASRGRATSPTSSLAADAAGCWCYGAAADAGRRSPTPQPDYARRRRARVRGRGTRAAPARRRELRRARRAAAARRRSAR